MIDAGMADTRQAQDVAAGRLGDQIDGLLDQMEAAADDVARELMGESGPVSSAPTRVPESDVNGAPPDDDAPATDAAVLDEQVGRLVDDAMVSTEPAAPAARSIESLDDELAALADDLMSADGGPIAGAVTDAGVPERMPEAETAAAPEPIDPAPTAEPAAPAPAVAEPEPEPKVEPAADVSTTEPEPSPSEIGTRVLSATIAAVELGGRPLANKPTRVKADGRLGGAGDAIQRNDCVGVRLVRARTG